MTANNDPLEFIKSMWSNMGINLPGMVTPTVDVDELEKRITDLKAVESWLKMNLNMLTMSIQGLEMQKTTLAAVKAMSQSTQAADGQPNPFIGAALNPALWPWNMMQQPTAEASTARQPEEPPRKPATKGEGKKPA